MSDIAATGGSPAVDTAVPVEQNPAHIPEPVSGLPEQQQPAQPEAEKVEKGEDGKKPPRSIEESLKEAVKRSKDDQAQKAAKPGKEGDPAAEQGKEPKQSQQPANKAQGEQQAQQRGQQPVDPAQAQQRANEGQTAHREAPRRFDDNAKAEWASVPESVRGATHRAISELEQGVAKYKESADAYEELREFDTLAKQTGTTVKQALTNYVGVEQRLASQDINVRLATLDEIVQKTMGTSLRQVAAAIMGQKPDQVSAQKDQQIAGLTRQLGQVTQALQSLQAQAHNERLTGVRKQIQEFTEGGKHPRFDELTSDIVFLLKAGRAKDLSDAYEMADRLNPASSSAAHTGTPTALAQTQARQPEPANPAGQKSISGSPSVSTGAELPKGKKKGPAPSVEEALKNALKRAS